MLFALSPVPFYFLRHGVTDHNLRRLVMGQLDIPLNELGRRQAESAAMLVRGLGLGRVISSPLSRARETAEIVAGRLHLSVEVIEDLKERDWGSLTGRSHRDLVRSRHNPPGAESADDFSRRILAALTFPPAPDPVLVVAHSGACRVLRRFLAIDDGEGPVPNAVPLVFAPRPEGGWSERTLSGPVARADFPKVY